MELRNWIGIIIALVGAILQPIGWMYVYWIHALSFILIFVGILIFATQKYIEKSEEKEFGTGAHRDNCPRLGDVHGYSGWNDGGRIESWSSNNGGSDGGGGGC
ncbi:hypothetical protein QUF74_04510 [Candidatus Halobeggiatoa sp. HSG11]|nr:hypothetical protein [Candidatus Halobeggiatoa sp. HSG11]